MNYEVGKIYAVNDGEAPSLPKGCTIRRVFFDTGMAGGIPFSECLSWRNVAAFKVVRMPPKKYYAKVNRKNKRVYSLFYSIEEAEKSVKNSIRPQDFEVLVLQEVKQ